ncbi:MAG: energy transducer TonB [Candidatus Eremiobacteraeota bacterium]|nr:energy transducer TonB [Candidatus Eremiobacteraeota bacterium]
MKRECVRAETLAGAIALGEATDTERDAYRRHLADCSTCVALLCGEREIERVVRVVREARDGESWEPDLRAALQARAATRRIAWGFGLSGALIAVAISLGVHALVAAGIPNHAPIQSATVAYSGIPVVLERRSHRAPAAVLQHAPSPDRKLVVLHNVVTLNRPPVAAKVAPVRHAAHPSSPVTHQSSVAAQAVAAITPSERDESAIAALRTTATTAPPAARAESIAMVPNLAVVRDVMPIGGDTAIVPHPSAIAYDEGAQGTTAFEVSVDEHGTPVKCTITKPSGYLVLDDAVCKAAMHARYSPRTINGRPVAGIYRDAFTFRTSDQE